MRYRALYSYLFVGSLIPSIGVVAAGEMPVAHAQSEDDASSSESDVESREAEIFGRPESSDSETESASSETETTSDEKTSDSDEGTSEENSDRRRREEEMFGEQTGESTTSNDETEDRIAERLDDRRDTLAIGGTYFGRLQYSMLGEGKPETFPLSQPNILDLYLDARPRERLRLFVQGRLTFDPTALAENQTSSGPLGALTSRREPLEIALDQLWLKFDVARTLYITIGRQQVRWGVGRFWFPNDFLFAQRRDPVAIFDERTGVDLVRLHLPIPSLNWNLYAVANLSGATSPERVGGAVRSEFLVGQTEWSLSAAYRDERPLRLGFDISTGIGPFDLRGAISVARGVEQEFYRGSFDPESLADPNPLNWQIPESYSRQDEWLPRALAGGEVGIRYGGDDTLFLGAEYFFNDFGYSDPDLYPWLLFQEAFRPFYVGRHYGALYALLPSPGRWEEGSVTVSTLANLNDPSFLSRLDLSTTLLEELRGYVFGSVTYGAQGEFNLRIDLPPVPAASGQQTPIDVSDGLTLPALRGSVGLGVQLDY